jgi:streptogramin lyase
MVWYQFTDVSKGHAAAYPTTQGSSCFKVTFTGQGNGDYESSGSDVLGGLNLKLLVAQDVKKGGWGEMHFHIEVVENEVL